MAGNPIVELRIRLDEESGREITIVGRDAWALGQLLKAGGKGCTPIEQPAPRWSHYVYKLRRAGLVIETVTENHAGAYAGHHARYVLRSKVNVVSTIRAGEERHAA